MKHIRNVGAVALAAVALAGTAPAQSAAAIAGAKGIYEREVAKIEVEYQATLKGLPALYEKKLEELGARLQKAGDLDALLAINKEKARFKADRTVPDSAPADLPTAAAKLQEEHRAAREQAGKDRSAKIASLTQKYVARLETIKKDLTSQGKLDDAVAVREEIKRVEGSDAYAKARLEAPAEEAKPGSPEPAKGKEAKEPESLRKGLVLHYSFDKDEGATVKDLSGQNNDGTVHGAVWVPKGISGAAYEFDGQKDYILAGPVPAGGVPKEMTFAVWVRPLDLTRKDFSTILARNFGGGEQFGIRFTRDTLYAQTTATAWGFAKDQVGSFRDGNWYHLVVVTSQTDNRGTVYGNGNMLATGRLEKQSVAPIRGDLFVGRDNRNEPTYFKGTIDEVRIYDRALSPPEVKALYDLHAAGPKPGLPPVIEAKAEPQAPATTRSQGKLPRILLPGGGGEKMDTAKLYQRAVPAVVVVAGRRGHGSGIVVGRKDIVLTNAHVVQDEATVKVYPFVYQNDKLKRLEPLDGEVVYRSEDEDIAVVKFDRGPAIAPLPVTRKNPTPGTKVFAIGSPGLGDLTVLEQSITEGIVSAGARDFGGQSFVQHTAAVNPGNSGGPLLNEQGEVVGMITLKAFLEGVSFAIPADRIRNVFEKR